MIPSYIDLEAIFDHYDAVFFDAYGVLVDGIDSLPNAEHLVNMMNTSAMNYFIVTNDASKSTESEKMNPPYRKSKKSTSPA